MRWFLGMFFMLTGTLLAEQYYLEIKSNPLSYSEVSAYICVPVANKVEAQTLANAYTNDPDLFLGLDCIIQYHTCRHGNPNETCGVELMKKADMNKCIELEEETPAQFSLPIIFRLPVSDDNDAKKKEKKVKDMFPTKTFKVKKKI